jgi:hypothetical protein
MEGLSCHAFAYRPSDANRRKLDLRDRTEPPGPYYSSRRDRDTEHAMARKGSVANACKSAASPQAGCRLTSRRPAHHAGRTSLPADTVSPARRIFAWRNEATSCPREPSNGSIRPRDTASSRQMTRLLTSSSTSRRSMVRDIGNLSKGNVCSSRPRAARRGLKRNPCVPSESAARTRSDDRVVS